MSSALFDNKLKKSLTLLDLVFFGLGNVAGADIFVDPKKGKNGTPTTITPHHPPTRSRTFQLALSSDSLSRSKVRA